MLNIKEPFLISCTLAACSFFLFCPPPLSAQCSANLDCSTCGGSGKIGCSVSGGAGCTTSCDTGCDGGVGCSQNCLHKPPVQLSGSCGGGSGQTFLSRPGLTIAGTQSVRAADFETVAYVPCAASNHAKLAHSRLLHVVSARQNQQPTRVTTDTIVSPSIPIEIRNVSVVTDALGLLKQTSYDIQNNGSNPLIAWDVRVEAFASPTDTQPFFAFDVTRDAWIGPQVSGVQPGANLRDSANISSTLASPAHVTMTVRYAEFADGTRLGPGASVVYQSILARREQVRHLVEEISTMSQRTDSAALISWLKRPRQQGESFASYSYRTLLGDIAKEQGMQAMMQEVTRTLQEKM